MLLVLMLGCMQEEKESEEEDPYPGYTTSIVRPVAGWDPTRVVYSLTGSTQLFPPIMYDAAGQQIAFKPLSIRETAYAFIADPLLSPGSYTITGTTHLDFDPLHPVNIGNYGADPAFEPQSIVGTTWKFENYPSILMPDLYVYSMFLGDTYVEISSVEGNEVGFRVVTTIFGSEDQCQLLQATGTVNEDGEFFWSAPTIDAQTEQETLHMKNSSLHWGWTSELQDAFGVEGSTELDTRVLDPYIYPDHSDHLGDTCYFIGVNSCYSCDTDGEPYCATFLFHGAWLSRSDAMLAPELPICGVDLEAAGGVPTFDFGCEPVEYDPLCAMLWLPFVGFGIKHSRRKTTSSPDQPTS